MNADADTRPNQPVAVIVPVYRNLQVTRSCLDALVTSDLPEQVSITIIDDNSPEEDVRIYCRELAERPDIRLVVNEKNLGFVVTSNKGFTLEPDADIILLNSDTIVSNNWVQRLQACAYREENIGTVTPFSNNGTICSYPVFPISNSMPEQWNAVELDRAFQSANSGNYYEIPTAVGFCMYIKRSCLNETGPFDTERFGHGYGEECDFSMRARAKGWKHVIATDIFVYHEGAVSFASESAVRKSRADGIMDKLHPQYHELVSEFIQSDPLYGFRKNVDAIRLLEKPADSINMLEEHFRYTRTILERVAENRRAMISEQAQRQQLEKMLADCRLQFAETNSALVDAQEVVARLREESRIHIEQLTDHIRNMEQSRSWRYTAWLRRN